MAWRGRLISTIRLGWFGRLCHRHAVTQYFPLDAQLLAERLFGLARQFIAGHQLTNAIKPLAQIFIGKLVGWRCIVKINLGLGLGFGNCRVAVELLSLLCIGRRSCGGRLGLSDRRLFHTGGCSTTAGGSARRRLLSGFRLRRRFGHLLGRVFHGPTFLHGPLYDPGQLRPGFVRQFLGPGELAGGLESVSNSLALSSLSGR